MAKGHSSEEWDKFHSSNPHTQMLSHPLYERLLARLQHLQGHCPSTRLQVVFFPSCPGWKHHHLPILLKGNLIFGIIAIARYNALLATLKNQHIFMEYSRPTMHLNSESYYSICVHCTLHLPSVFSLPSVPPSSCYFKLLQVTFFLL